MSDDVHAYYRSQSRITDPGRRADLYANLPSSVAELVTLVQGLVIDKDLVALFGLDIGDVQRLGELDTRYLSEILALLLTKDPRPLDDRQEPSKRFIGSCRDYALLLCSLLRHAGIAARLGCGIEAARSRMANVLGPVTWASLEVRK